MSATGIATIRITLEVSQLTTKGVLESLLIVSGVHVAAYSTIALAREVVGIKSFNLVQRLDIHDVIIVLLKMVKLSIKI